LVESEKRKQKKGNKRVSRWVEEELNGSRFKDKRLNKRFKLMVDRLIERPEASLPQAMASWAETKATYRFLDSEKVTPKEIRAGHIQSTIKRAIQQPRVLIIQDTTSLDFTEHKDTSGLGYLDRPYIKGLFMHSALCCSSEGVPLGLLDQQVWTRDLKDLGKKYKRAQRPFADKESAKWVRALKSSLDLLPESVATLTIADREADIFELFVAPRLAKADLLIRACRERRIKLNDEVDHLWPVMLMSPVRGKVTIEVSANKERKPRTVSCSIHFEQVSLLPPITFRHQEALSLGAILVREEGAQEGVKPLEWLLLTTLRVESIEEALQGVKWYSLRWLVERYHLVLKSGCRIEKLQLEAADRLERAVAVYSIVAWRLLWLTYEARRLPEASCELALEKHEWESLYCTIKRTHILPTEPPTLRQAVRWIAQLGGFLGRKCDGEPGVMVIWRGFRRLEDISSTWQLLTLAKDVGNG
jgi:hypothetical protein